MKDRHLTINNDFVLKVSNNDFEFNVIKSNFNLNSKFNVDLELYLSDNISYNLDLLLHLCKYDNLIDCNNYNIRKQDIVFDCVLYEYNDNNELIPVVTLHNSVLSSFTDSKDKIITLQPDWYEYNIHSNTYKFICDYNNQWDEEEYRKYNELLELCDELDIDPNESVFSNNFRKSFNKFDWFKPYKIIRKAFI